MSLFFQIKNSTQTFLINTQPLTSFHGSSNRTLGSINLEFPIENDEPFFIKFRVVNHAYHSDALDLDGILRNTFVKRGQVSLDYRTKLLEIRSINLTTKIYNLHDLPKPSSRINQIKTRSEILKENLHLDHLLTSKQLQDFSDIFHPPNDKLKSNLTSFREINLTDKKPIHVRITDSRSFTEK